MPSELLESSEHPQCNTDFQRRTYDGVRRIAYPQVRFVHVTFPLTTGSSDDNVVREQFGDLVRQTFGGTDAVFDLAKVESTRSDGRSEVFGRVRAHVGAYSSDGGHLNATGADVVARALISFLASL